MLTKFDLYSARVKAICFHKQRTWVICGLHNGDIQIWDYRMNTFVDSYAQHSGSVRGIDFHPSQPLFVSGGDDFTVKVWNFKLRRCLYTLNGHVDFVRTTFFHAEQPWIVSCSDDMTIRIWNWQNRKCVATLPGHGHYVMCAQFHPKHDIVASASLDKTIRLWDISSLRDSRRDNASNGPDLLGSGSEVMVTAQIEAHSKGVNWVAFHPTEPYFVSAGDDRIVKIWRYQLPGTHVDCYRVFTGHTNNVCSATFFLNEYILACGEDMTVRVWHMNNGGQAIKTYRRDRDRYWILATSNEKKLVAAGHDNGLQVFKLFRERPPYAVAGGKLFYISGDKVLAYDFDAGSVTATNPIVKSAGPPHSISVSPGNTHALIWNPPGSAGDAGWTTLLDLKSDRKERTQTGTVGAIFFGANKYAFINSSEELCMFNIGDGKTKTLETSFRVSAVFPAPLGYLLCQSKDTMYLYQVAQHGAVAECNVADVRYVVWDKDYHKVALLCRNSIHVMTKKLKSITSITESTARIKSAAFDEVRDVLYYTTSNHLKYCSIRNGECGTISTLKNVVYLVRAHGDTIWVITRNGVVVSQTLENFELNFKTKLHQRAYRDVLRLIQDRDLKSQALVGYLHKHGHAEIALHFVSDAATRFNLAIECGALDIAKAAAAELNETTLWGRLAEAAIKFGDLHLAIFAANKSGNHHQLGLLSLISGDVNTLRQQVAASKDESFRFQYSLYLDQDADQAGATQRVQLLLEGGQLPLAYLTTKSAGLLEEAERILAQLPEDVAERVRATPCAAPSAARESAVVPMTENWPMLQVEKSAIARLLTEPGQLDSVAALAGDAAALEVSGNEWDMDDDDDDGMRPAHSEGSGDGALDGLDDADEGAGWDNDLDIDTDAILPGGKQIGTTGAGGYVVPREVPGTTRYWEDHYNLPAFHVASGSFGTAIELLRRQIGLVNASPLADAMMRVWSSVNAARPGCSVPATLFPLTGAAPSEDPTAKHAPKLPDLLPAIKAMLLAGYKLFQEGKFADAHSHFVQILHLAVLTTVRDNQQKAGLREVLTVVPEYARALAVQLKLRGAGVSVEEGLQLTLYFTHFKLHPAHHSLALLQAMTKLYKAGNIKMAAGVARRVLDQNVAEKKLQQANAIIAQAETAPADPVQLDYDERNPFVLCSVSMKPMYRGTVEPIRCPYCLSPAHPDHRGTVCPVCRISAIGEQCAGIQNEC